MAEAIDTAFVVVKPDTRGFGAQTRREVAQQLRQQPVAAPPIKRDRRADRDLVPRVGVRGPAIRGLLAFGTTLTGVTGGVIAAGLAFRTAFNEMKEGQAVAAQTTSILKGTGNVAGVSADGVAAYSQELSKLSGIDDEIVQTGANIILTFKNVRNVAGEGNAIFDEALSTAVDLSRVAGGAFGDLNSTSKQLGKALNDPIKGMTALSRSGVTFSASQKETIKSLVESGQTLAAQKLILQEVQSQIGPAAEAYGQTLPGAIDRTKNAISNLLGSGLEKVAPGLADGAEAVADFFESLGEGGTGASQIKQAFDLVRSAVTPLFKAIRSEGPRFKSIFASIQQIVKNMMPSLKVLAAIVGVTLVVAFKVVIRVLDLFFKNIVRVQELLEEATIIILRGLEKLLDGAAKVASGLNTLLPGNPFGGAEDSANAAKEAVQGLIRELEATDGKSVSVKVKVNQEVVTTASPGGRTATAPDATGGKRGGKTVADIPGPREAKEQQLIAKIGVEQARGNVAAERALLTQLVAFYAESLRLARERGVVRRDFQQKYEQALADIRAIDQQAADDAKQAADDAKAANDERLAALDSEHRALLELNIEIAAGTKRIIRDDKKAWAAYIAYLKTRVALARQAGVGIAAARAELRAARQQAVQTVKDFVQARFDEQEAFLQGQTDLFDVTGQEGKLAQAYKKLIAFYKRMVKREGLTRLERQKYRIALAQTRKDLAELNDETGEAGKDGATFGQLAVDFLKNLHGFSSNLASNVMPRGTSTGVTESLASATAAAKGAAKAAATTGNLAISGSADRIAERVARGESLAPHGVSAAQKALDDRAAAQGPATAAQFERLLSQNAAILRVLRRIAQDQDHPTAKFNRKQSPASVVVGVS